MNDDTLILYYYNDELSDRERRRIAAAIETDAGVAARYEVLCRQLDDISEPQAETVPAHLLQRWHDTIDRAAQREPTARREPRSSFNPFSFAWGAAVTAALAIGIGIGVFLGDGATSPPGRPFVDVGTSESAAVPVAFTRGVKMYLRDTQNELATLSADAGTDRTLLILQIIEQNRLFERAAEQHDSQSLARVLRAFEPILLRLAADDIAPEDAEALRSQLAFELKVMLTKLSRDTSNGSLST